jgi:hypothetical protein
MIVTALMPAPAGTYRFGRVFPKNWEERGWGAFGVQVDPVADFAACHDAQGRSEIRALTHGDLGSYALNALEDFPHGGVPSYHVAGSLEDAVAHATGNLSALCTRTSRQPDQAERFVRHYWFPLVEHQNSGVEVALQHVPGCPGFCRGGGCHRSVHLTLIPHARPRG